MEHWDIASLAVEPHKPQVLRSDEETRAIALMLPAGEELQEHQVHERSYLLVIDGEVEVLPGGAAGGDPITGGPGLLLHFKPAERRTVRARSESKLLLVLAPWPGVDHPSRRENESPGVGGGG